MSCQSVHDAEGELEIAKMRADKARSNLEQARLRLREQQHEGSFTHTLLTYNEHPTSQ